MTDENKCAGWSVSTLHAHLLVLINERFTAAQKAVEVAEKNLTRLTDQRFESAQNAVQLAQAENERRLAELNNLRKEVTNDRQLFLKREVFDQILKEWSAWRDAANNRLTTIETRSITWTAALGILFVLIQIAMYWLRK